MNDKSYDMKKDLEFTPQMFVDMMLALYQVKLSHMMALEALTATRPSAAMQSG